MATEQAPTVRVSMFIERGLTVETPSGSNVFVGWRDQNVYEDLDGTLCVEDGYYYLSYHQGYMPAYAEDRVATLQELANAMRDIEDLRKWCVIKGEQ